MPDREAKTPRQSGEWAITVGRCEAYASRLSRAETERRMRTSKHHDPAAADFCHDKAERFRAIIDEIEAWPRDPARKAQNKVAVYSEIAQLQRWADDHLRGMGTGW